MPSLNTKIANNDVTVTVVGMGYVGLPLALNFAKAGLRTFGLDIDPQKVATLNRGESYIEHIEAARIATVLEGGNFVATTEFSCVVDSINPGIGEAYEISRGAALGFEQDWLRVSMNTLGRIFLRGRQ